jgi:NAD dependent epimerase/dehydratase family enzyme
MSGSYNAVAPEHITNKELIKKIAKKLKRPLWLPNIPSAFIKMIFGEMSVIILNGSRISSERIKRTNFKFQYPSIDSALENLIK